MKRIFTLIPVFVILIFASSCKDKDNNATPQPTEMGKILVSYPWNMKTVTDVTGKVIPENQWDIVARSLPHMNIEFQTGNKVFARGVGDPKVENGGSWYISEDGKALDIDVIGIEGAFFIEELSNTRMRLRKKMPVAGVEQDGIMVFEPVVR